MPGIFKTIAKETSPTSAGFPCASRNSMNRSLPDARNALPWVKSRAVSPWISTVAKGAAEMARTGGPWRVARV